MRARDGDADLERALLGVREQAAATLRRRLRPIRCSTSSAVVLRRAACSDLRQNEYR